MKVLFLGPLRSSFASVDVDIMRRSHQVTTVDTIMGRGMRGVLRLIGVSIKSVAAVVTHDVVYCWFADYHTLLPVLLFRFLGKKAIVVAGGFDIGYEPQINFGARIRPVRWFCVRHTFRSATKILCVSQYAQNQLTTLTNGKHAPSSVVYNAVRTDLANDAIVYSERQPLVVTVSQGDSDVEILRKGIDVFVRVAKLMPHVTFRLIGLAGNHFVVQSALATTPNLEVYAGFVSFEDVVKPAYTLASAYAQLSIEEAFGVAMVEAMTCGCIPVTTGRAALNEVVGGVGFEATTDEAIVAAIEAALESTIEKRRSARIRGLEFSAERRSIDVLRAVTQTPR